MGVVSLEEVDLRVKARCGNESDQASALRLLPLIEHRPHHQLLVTLLLLNACANEALPLFLDEIFDPLTAILISVSAVLLIGEIVPAAIFTGPAKLKIASTLAGFVWVLLYALAPVAYPIGWMLDKLIPERVSPISRAEVRALVDVHRELAVEHASAGDETVSAEEAQLVRGAMTLASRLVVDVMLPLEDVFALPSSSAIDQRLLETLVQRGYSRVPLYEGTTKAQLVSYVIVKELLTASPGLTMGAANTRAPAWAGPMSNLFELLQLFKSGRCHMAFVSRNPELAAEAVKRGLPPTGSAAAIGIITLEDILEEILAEEIVDESDVRSAEDAVRSFIPQLRERLQRKLHPSQVGITGSPSLRARGVFSEREPSMRLLPDATVRSETSL